MTNKVFHIVGICGTLMGAFAAYLKRMNMTVTGSDQNIYPPMSDVLNQAGIDLFQGYHADNIKNLKQKPDLVIIGNVINKSNVEAQFVIQNGYAYASLPEAMEKLFLNQTHNIVVAGTHGKTTTSSLLAYVLVQCNQDPGYFIGGVSHDLPYSFHVPELKKGSYFVLEGDEYDTAFWDKVPKFNHYLPQDVILTSIEFDHADIYKDLNAVIFAFEGLLQRMNKIGGKLICCWDEVNIQNLKSFSTQKIIRYGSYKQKAVDYYINNIQINNGINVFDIYHEDKKIETLKIQLPGLHNALNALAVWIECKELGLNLEKVKSALLSFKGVKRRQEVRANVHDILVIDDFAHHPTAVRETIKAFKMKYSGKRLITVFEPRSATSRRKVFQKAYVEAFKESDVIRIAKPFNQTGIDLLEQFSSEELVSDLKKFKKDADVMSDVESGIQEITSFSKSGDVIAVLSNGGFQNFIPQLIENLEKKWVK